MGVALQQSLSGTGQWVWPTDSHRPHPVISRQCFPLLNQGTGLDSGSVSAGWLSASSMMGLLPSPQAVLVSGLCSHLHPSVNRARQGGLCLIWSHDGIRPDTFQQRGLPPWVRESSHPGSFSALPGSGSSGAPHPQGLAGLVCE